MMPVRVAADNSFTGLTPGSDVQGKKKTEMWVTWAALADTERCTDAARGVGEEEPENKTGWFAIIWECFSCLLSKKGWTKAESGLKRSLSTYPHTRINQSITSEVEKERSRTS